MKNSSSMSLVLSFALLSSTMAFAGPFDAVKKAAKDAGKALGAEPATQDTASSESSEEAPSTNAGGATVATAAGPATRPGRKDHDEYPPGFSFSTVLNGVKYLADKAQFRLDNLQATFIGNDAEGCIVLRKADGQELYQYDWKVDTFRDMKPYYLLNIMGVKNLRTGETQSATWVELKETGGYVLDCYLPDEHFYTFPFSISKISGNDPFAEKDRWFIDGDWEDWAYFYYADADPEKSLQFKVWLRNKSAGDDRSVKPKLEVQGPGGLVCVGRDITLTLKPDWVRYELDMIFPPQGTSGGAYFKAGDLLKQDGKYSLTMKLDEEHYGAWEFAIKDGRFVPAGRTVRGEADPLTFVEGGRDAFWYKRQ